MPVTYPFDPTGNNASNLVIKEQNIVNAHQYLNYYIVIPTFSPFFLNNLQISYKDQSGVITTLTKGTDYDVALPYIGATRGLGLPVYGGIVFYDTTLDGMVEYNYQTVGGDWIADPNYVLGVLAQKAYNPRTVIWDVLTNKPNCFPPQVHYQPYDDIQGQSDVVNAIMAIRDAIANKGNPLGDLAPHISNYNNPHQVTAEQVKLGNVSNLPLASDYEVLNAEPLDKYITLRQLSIVCQRVINANRQVFINPDGGANYFPTSDTTFTTIDVTLKQFYFTTAVKYEVVIINGDINVIDPNSLTGVINLSSTDLGETKTGSMTINFTVKSPIISYYINFKAINGVTLFKSKPYYYTLDYMHDFLFINEYGVCPYI